MGRDVRGLWGDGRVHADAVGANFGCVEGEVTCRAQAHVADVHYGLHAQALALMHPHIGDGHALFDGEGGPANKT
jgi:hypothetical protein